MVYNKNGLQLDIQKVLVQLFVYRSTYPDLAKVVKFRDFKPFNISKAEKQLACMFLLGVICIPVFKIIERKYLLDTHTPLDNANILGACEQYQAF